MRFITHEEAYEVSTKNHDKIEVPGGTLQFPQVDTLAEAVEFCGGEEKVVELFNDLVYSRSKNGALALVRNAAKDADINAAIQKAAAYSKGYDPSQERVSKAAIIEGVDKIRELGKEKLAGMSQEELLELLTANLKI